MNAHNLTDRDRGAIAALRLLSRSDEVREGEEVWTETASDIIAAIEREGLAATIRFQMDAETDYLIDQEVVDEYEPFPADLAEIAAEALKTKWQDKP